MRAILLALALASCTPDEPDLRVYGEPSTEAICRVCAALPHLPASPWPCVRAIYLDRACEETEGCYLPQQGSILTTQAALAHELGHSAAECATGDPDREHRAAWWKDVR